ncbi:MAG: PAS domain S-box protein, partial [Syntrophus sp. (in: bacteria)]
PEDLVGQKFLDFLPDKAARKDVRRQYMSLTPENPIKTYEHEVVVADGTNQARWHRWTDRAFFSDKDEIIHFQSIGQDITERKQDEKSLLESENRYRFLIDNATDVIWTLDMEMRLKYISPSVTTLLGFTVEEAMKRPIEQALTPVSVEKAMRIFTERMALQSKSHSDPTQSSIIELEMVHKDGHTVPVEGHFRFLRDAAGEINGLIAIMRDLTDRKRAEKSLRESEENYRTLFENATEIIFVAQDGKVVFHNPKVAAMFGYYGEEVIQRPFIEFIHPDDRDMVVERHIRRMKGQDVPHTYSFRFIQKDGVVRWVDLSAVMIEWKGKPATLNFLTDITDRKKAEEKLQNTLESLRKAIGATIQVMVSAIESRDPYTAGHQKRSSALARDIATEMGLPPEKIDGIRMAGSIHDIGKMSIPSEILSKPTNLSEFEFPLIKEHAQKGYDILKDVESPWPLAEIVYQHHERMNGSGYPRNLKGEEILMEARILAVADVVESMASHRPYRPAKGIKVALEEIENNKGTLYDEAVVDACLRLFREKGYQLEVT